ncbi:MAG: DUF1697 domain-containing protein [Opitutaceae bacterium]|nr:DUF1697 domain-containing protein [Opitutaceae bacterium]
MPRAVALLRGINVGGHRVAMADLRRHCEALRLKNVATFIASGNVIFDAAAGADLAALERRMEKHLAEALGFAAPTFIRTVDEIAIVAAAEPFSDAAPTDSLYVSFLRAAPDAAAQRAVLALESRVDMFCFRGRELYWRCRGKISEVSIAWPKLEKLAKTAKLIDGTSRNITSVRKLLAAMGGEKERP